MGLSIQFTGAADGDDGPFDLASAQGWSLFAEWAAELPAGDEFAPVLSLANDGEFKGTDTLSAALSDALDAHPPASADVRHTVDGLLKNMGVGDPAETATVVGIGGDDDGA